jgi:predicted peptidase
MIKPKNIKLVAILSLLLFLENAFSQNEAKGIFSTQFSYTKNYGYVLQSPDNKKDKKALIVFLHGSGERGTDTEKVKIHGPLKYTKTHKIDAYILAPQCPDNESWDAEMLYRLIQKIQKENNIDPQRIYLTGMSMGGLGAWQLSFKHPEMFAAVVPICGFINLMDDDEICNIKNIPTRIFHGALDDVVDVKFAIAIYRQLKECGGDVQMTIFDNANHDSWSRVYDNPETYDWMLKQTKK